MTQIEMLSKEMAREAETTRKMLSRIPDDKYDWKPHEKSMSIRQLATHIAELPSWVNMVLDTAELDFATTPYDPKQINNTEDLMAYFEACLAGSSSRLSQAKDGDLDPTWILRNGEEIYSESSKGEMIRVTYCQIVHHRAQMGVFLRLLNIPIPGSYGPSADEMPLFN